MRWAPAALALVLLAGCATPRAGYLRGDLAPGELTLAASGKGQLMILEGQADGPPLVLGLEHLTPAVACVPDAVSYVDAAKSIRTTGAVMKYIGWAAAVTGIAVFAYSAIQQDDRFLRPAIAVASSGGLLTQTPDFLRPFVIMKMIDAVYAFEDQKYAIPGCGLRGPRPAPPARLTAPPAPKRDEGPGPGGPRF